MLGGRDLLHGLYHTVGTRISLADGDVANDSGSLNQDFRRLGIFQFSHFSISCAVPPAVHELNISLILSASPRAKRGSALVLY